MIRVGTCSWTEKTLIQSGEFYPPGINTAESRLRYYASQFDTVEVDSTYYAIPNIRNVTLWQERTPENFVFHIKAYGALTGHGIDPKTLPIDISSLLQEKDKTAKYIYIRESELLAAIADRFRNILTPLVQTKKLGLLVYQFPPWFIYRSSNLDYILTCKNLMHDLAIGVEFRHSSWLMPNKANETLRFLQQNQITYITADEPQNGQQGTIPFLPDVTTEIGYFRFHGRNKETWFKKGIETSQRFNYYYSDEELNGLAPAIKKIDAKAKVSYLMFNNCFGGLALRNALYMKKLAESWKIK